jgi:predicted nucleic acid-binding protein
MIFVDTSAFIARFNTKDKYQKESVGFFEKVRQERILMITSDYIIDETITTLFSRTRSFEIAKKYGEAIIGSMVIKKIWTSEKYFEEAWSIFKKEGSMGLSFTDCVSVAIMRGLNINRVFTFDSHFRLMGFEIVP